MGFALGKEPLPRALWLALGSDFFFFTWPASRVCRAPLEALGKELFFLKNHFEKKYLKKPFFAESGSQQRFIRFCREQLSAKD